jgi:hypothetical protein
MENQEANKPCLLTGHKHLSFFPFSFQSHPVEALNRSLENEEFRYYHQDRNPRGDWNSNLATILGVCDSWHPAVVHFPWAL